jgi:hypothetical protein
MAVNLKLKTMLKTTQSTQEKNCRLQRGNPKFPAFALLAKQQSKKLALFQDTQMVLFACGLKNNQLQTT